MAPIGTLNGPLVNFRNYKTRIAAKYAGVDIATTAKFDNAVDAKTPEYLAKFPLGKSPTYEGADGFRLFDSSAIAYYVASKGTNAALLGQTPEETGEIMQYILFAESDFTPAALGVIAPLLGFKPLIKPAFQEAEQQYARFLSALNDILADKTFLVGERVTIADIIVACDLIMTYKKYLTAEDRKQYRNVTRYFTTMVGQP
ncbi:Elongation factor 1-gamma, partial [Coemansia sp. RSA 2618]